MAVADFSQAQDWTFPVPIAYGPGRLAELGEICRAQGASNPLIVTDRASRDLPFVQGALDALRGAGLSADVFSEVSPNPTDKDAFAGVAVFRAGGHDAVVALGGGSGMDAGKAVSLLAGRDDDLWVFDYDLGVDESLTAADFPIIKAEAFDEFIPAAALSQTKLATPCGSRDSEASSALAEAQSVHVGSAASYRTFIVRHSAAIL